MSNKKENFVYREDGSVDWRKMVSEEHLYPNKTWFERYGKPIPDSIEGLSDNQLLIKLAGIKELAKMRGYESVDYEFAPYSTPEHVAVKCTIIFNPETEGGAYVKYSSLGNATRYNLDNFVAKFPEAMAENRAFVRCVRNFLNINIVGEDEIDKNTEAEVPDASISVGESMPNQILGNLIKKKFGVTDFEKFKDILRKLYKEGLYKPNVEVSEISNWEEYQDIPLKEVRRIIGTINNA